MSFSREKVAPKTGREGEERRYLGGRFLVYVTGISVRSADVDEEKNFDVSAEVEATTRVLRVNLCLCGDNFCWGVKLKV